MKSQIELSSVVGNGQSSRFGSWWVKRLGMSVIACCLLWAGSGAFVGLLLTARLQGPTEEMLPGAAKDSIQELSLGGSDGPELGAWFHRGDTPDCLLLLHGNGGSRTSWFGIFDGLSRSGTCVLAITMRAHGDSGGWRKYAGWGAQADVVTAVEFLERQVSEKSLIIVGSSMGSAAAIFAAERLGPRVAGYFLAAPYRDLDTAVRARTVKYLPPFLNKLALSSLRLWAPALVGRRLDQISPRQHAERMLEQIPVTLLSGSEDHRAPLKDVREIHTALGARSRLVVFDGAKHQGLFHYDGARYMKALAELRGRVETARRSPNSAL